MREPGTREPGTDAGALDVGCGMRDAGARDAGEDAGVTLPSCSQLLSVWPQQRRRPTPAPGAHGGDEDVVALPSRRNCCPWN